MTTAFGRRFELVMALEIAALLWIVILGAAFFGFGSFVQTVRGDLATQLQQTTTSLQGLPRHNSGERAARALATGYLRAGLTVVVLDGRERYELDRIDRADPHIAVSKAARGRGPNGNLEASGPFASVVLGLATAFGLHPLRGHVDTLDFLVRESEVGLIGAVAPFVLPFCLALALVTLFAFALARVLTRQALQPLVEVQAALERFASGDLTPQPLTASSRSSLGSLTVAYNGAIEQMQRAFTERERANASMRQFIADAGHQLRTPLTVLRGFIAILRKGELRSAQDREHILSTMHRQSALMGSLIDKLMLLDRWEETGERGEPVPIDVSRLVEDVVAPLAEARPERIVRVVAPGGELAAIDPSDLSHAVTNIVDNALKYTAGSIEIAVSAAADRVLVTIEDAGPGMSTDEAQHAFDRFFRGARRDVEGTGLGLAIARRAIERAGGTLDFVSALASGTRFTISLPAVPRTTAEPVPAASAIGAR